MFLEELMQADLLILTTVELEGIYPEVRGRAEEENPDAAASGLAFETDTRMKGLWQKR